MKLEPSDPLLDAVLDDDAAYRHSTLRQTLTLARTRRRRRVAVRALAGAAVLMVAGLLLRPPHPVLKSQPITQAPALSFVHSVPLSARESVRTRVALFDTVTSAPARMALIKTETHTVARVVTQTNAPMLDYLDDRQLLTAFRDQHPAIIAAGTPDARLVFY